MSFQKELVKNFFTVGGLKYSGLLIAFVGQAAISRLISPEEYGVHATGLLYYGLVSLFLDAGISMAIIRTPENEAFQRGIKAFSMALGIILCLILLVAGVFIGRWYNMPDLTYLLWIYAVILFVSSVTIPHEAILSKRKQFGLIAKLGLFITFIQLSITYFFALAGYSYWSLIWPLLICAVIKLVVYSGSVPISVRKIKKVELVSAVKDSSSLIKNMTLFQVLSYTSRNADNFYLSRLNDKTTLGFYNRAFQFTRLPINMLTGILSNIQLPMFQSLVDAGKQHQVKTEFVSYLKVLGAAGAPIVVVFHLLPYEISTFIWGAQWSGVGEYLLPLSILIPTTLMLNSCGNMFVLYRGERMLVYNSVISATALILGATIGSFVSIKAMIIGLITGSLMGSLPVTMYLGCYKTFGFTVAEIVDTWAFNFFVVVALLLTYGLGLNDYVMIGVLMVYSIVSAFSLYGYVSSNFIGTR